MVSFKTSTTQPSFCFGCPADEVKGERLKSTHGSTFVVVLEICKYSSIQTCQQYSVGNKRTLEKIPPRISLLSLSTPKQGETSCQYMYGQLTLSTPQQSIIVYKTVAKAKDVTDIDAAANKHPRPAQLTYRLFKQASKSQDPCLVIRFCGQRTTHSQPKYFLNFVQHN